MRLFYLLLLQACLLQAILADGASELYVRWKTKPTGTVRISIKPKLNTLVFDQNYNALPLGHAAYNEFTDPENVLWNFVGDGSPAGSAEQINGTVYYGLYEINYQIWNSSSQRYDPLPGSPVYLDFRDADYNTSQPYCNSYSCDYDFRVYYDAVGFQKVSDPATNYYTYVTCFGNIAERIEFGASGGTRTIWGLGNRTQNAAPFKNMNVQPTSTAAMNPVIVNINGANVTLAKDQLYFVAATGSTSIIVPHRAGSSIYFSQWENGALFDTIRSVSANLDGNYLQPSYKQSNQVTTITGPEIFTQKQTLTFRRQLAIPTLRAVFRWYVKWNFSNVWQMLGSDTVAYVTPNASSDYSFLLRCYTRDSSEQIVQYSAEDHAVDYAGGGGGGGPQIAQRDENSEYYAQSSGTASQSIPDFSTMSDVEKKEWLRPIKETVRASGYHFRWTENDPYTEGLDPYVEALDQEESMGAKSIPETIPSTTPEIKPALLSKTSSASSLSSMPEQFRITANYPNPFNPSTTIAFEAPEEAYVTLTVYNTLGQKVKTLYRGVKSSGRHIVQWDATNDSGNIQPSGIYIVLLQAGNFSQSHKITLMK